MILFAVLSQSAVFGKCIYHGLGMTGDAHFISYISEQSDISGSP